MRAWWREAVEAVLVPMSENLAGITPHSMRHAGMTYWFAQGVDHKRIQLWGGWSSLVQMLDTYRGVLDSLEVVDLEGIDLFAVAWGTATTDDTTVLESTVEEGEIVSMEAWRQRRTAG